MCVKLEISRALYSIFLFFLSLSHLRLWCHWAVSFMFLFTHESDAPGRHPETSDATWLHLTAAAFRSQPVVLSSCSAACLCEKQFFRLSWTTACSSGSDLQSDRFIVQLMIDGEFVTDLTQNTSDMAAWWATTRVVWSEGVQVSRVQDSCWHWIVLKCKYVKLHKSSC